MIAAKPFFHRLRGRLMGISDRMLAQHVELYGKYVTRLNAIEAAYPMTNWAAPAGSPAPGNDMAPAGLLQMPVAKLDLHMVGPIAEIRDKVLAEMRANDMTFVPNFYIGDSDWWTSNLSISINVPWYLANPTIWRLANRQSETTYTVEQAAKTMRHEIGHAVNYAFELWKRPEWTKLFGEFYEPYKDVFPSDPRSKAHVEYLDGVSEHYPQKHPDEDWAETFAAWLDPTSNWREKYADWPVALKKLEYLDKLQFEVLNRPPIHTYVGMTIPYTKLKGTVGELLGTAEGTHPFKGITGWSEHSELLKAEPETYNAIALHEIYFEHLDGFGHPDQGMWPPPLMRNLAEATWGSWSSYELDLRAILGSTNGWAVTYWDPVRNQLRNALVQGHDRGVPAGGQIVLALDSWEHAYFSDYGTRKDIYIAALMRNVNWASVEARVVANTPAGLFAVQEPTPVAPPVVLSGPVSEVKKGATRDEVEESAAQVTGEELSDEVAEQLAWLAKAFGDDDTAAADQAIEDLGETEEGAAWAMRFLSWVLLGADLKKLAAKHEGLVPVLREVSKLSGKTHRQIYWVKPEGKQPGDVEIPKPKGFDEANYTDQQARVVVVREYVKQINAGLQPPPVSPMMKEFLVEKLAKMVENKWQKPEMLAKLKEKLGVKETEPKTELPKTTTKPPPLPKPLVTVDLGAPAPAAPAPPAPPSLPTAGAGEFTAPTSSEAQSIRAAINKGLQYQGAPGAYGLEQAVALGANVHETKSLLQQWADSSTSFEAIKARAVMASVVAEMRGPPPSEMEAVEKERQAIQMANKYIDKENLATAVEAGLAKRESMKKNLASLAKVSQAMHDEETITLYRGVSGKQAEAVKTWGHVDTGSLVSFTDDPTVALGFNHKVVKVTVPRSSIAISYKAFRGHGMLLKSEKEIVIMSSGRLKAEMHGGY